MKFETNNINYAATVVALDKFVDLPNCDNVKSAIIFGNSVIVGKDCKPGDVGLFFPVETQIDSKFLGANNLFRKAELGNTDLTKQGFFEHHGRVKAVKFRGHRSEGFWVPLEFLAYLNLDLSEIPLGAEFQSINGVSICQKYVPKQNPASMRQFGPKKAKIADRIVENQFRFHIDTANLRRNIGSIMPDDWISISEKWHGTSAIVSNLLVKRELLWYERALKALGVKIKDTHYGLTWSSRRVIKGVEEAKEGSVHYYGDDIWGEVAKEVADLVPKGVTLYGEIVGYTSNGSPIQALKGGHYHYGCCPGQHKFLVYRATHTNEDGMVNELPWLQMEKFCNKFGLEMVKPLFYGQAGNFMPFDGGDIHKWQQDFLAALESEYIKDKMCKYNDFKVPEEGIVVRKDHLDCVESYKIKNFKFLDAESAYLDTPDAVDVEEQQ